MSDKTLYIIVGIIVLIFVGIVIYLLSSNKSDKKPDIVIPGADTGSGGGGGGGPLPTTSIVGKTVYANKNGVPVFKSVDQSLYKTAAKDEWIGKVKEVVDNYYVILEPTNGVQRFTALTLVYAK